MMKHFLLFELLFTQIFLFTACKNNTTSAGKNGRHLPFDNSVYLSIPHSEEHSILRRKLLKLVPIENGDEFKFDDDSSRLLSVNFEEYNNFKSNSAEVIISYKDHLDIYFVPTGIERNEVLDQLEAPADPDTSFYWPELTDDFLLKSKVYYLLNAT